MKNPQYRDVLYVDEIIGPGTVNTMPPATLEAFRDHGQVRASLEDDIESAHAIMAALEEVGIWLREVTDQLLSEGVRLFAEPFDKLGWPLLGWHRAPSVCHRRRSRLVCAQRWLAGGALPFPHAGTRAHQVGTAGVRPTALPHRSLSSRYGTRRRAALVTRTGASGRSSPGGLTGRTARPCVWE